MTRLTQLSALLYLLLLVVAACTTAETSARRDEAKNRVEVLEAQLAEAESRRSSEVAELRAALVTAEHELEALKRTARFERAESGAGTVEAGAAAAYPFLQIFAPQYAPAAAATAGAAATLREVLRRRKGEP